MAKKTEKAIIEKIKHIETFYEKPPPGTVKEHEDKPEECIPDTEGNRKAREFLASAPTKGLWMPLGREVKVMQCWKCKNYGHRTGDKECPLFTSGNASNEKFREMYEDPMYSVLNSETRKKQGNKLRWLQQLLDDSSTDSDDNKSKKSKKKKKKKHENEWVEKKANKESDDKGKKAKKHKRNKSVKSSADKDTKRNKREENSDKRGERSKRSNSSTNDEYDTHKKKKKHSKHDR